MIRPNFLQEMKAAVTMGSIGILFSLMPNWCLWVRTGNLAARHVRLENPAQPVKYQGVVSTIKDSYGFIERADVVDEIFFHFSEAKNIPGGLKLGDDVEFFIQTRNVSKSSISIFGISSRSHHIVFIGKRTGSAEGKGS